MFEKKWKYNINPKTFDELNPRFFKNYRFTTVLGYLFFAIILNILKVALFASDIYTCVKLLAYNSWSNNIIKPYLSFRISKWLYSACILFSVILLFWESSRGIRVYRTKNIALSYINSFCQTVYYLRSYSMYCVFDKVTTENRFQNIAFFTFFELKNCFRLLFTDTPRQVINGLTLWSVLITANGGDNMGELESLQGIIQRIKEIAKTNYEEAVLLSFMLFSFILWLFFILKFGAALVSTVYVYHHLIAKREYSGLREYVCLTVNRKVDDLIEEQNKLLSGEKGSLGYHVDPRFLSDFNIKLDTSMDSYTDSTDEQLGMKHFTKERPIQQCDYLPDIEKDNYYDPDLNKDYTFNVNTYDNKKDENIEDIEHMNYKNDKRDEISEADMLSKPLRVTSIIFDSSMNYFKDKVYTFDVRRHLQSRIKQSGVRSSDSLKLGNRNNYAPNIYSDNVNFDRGQTVQLDLSEIGFISKKYDKTTRATNFRGMNRPVPPAVRTQKIDSRKVFVNDEFSRSSIMVLDKVHKAHHHHNIYTPLEAYFSNSRNNAFSDGRTSLPHGVHQIDSSLEDINENNDRRYGNINK